MPADDLTSTSTCSSSSLFALQVLDDSMAPEFTPGHVVVVDSSARLVPGSYVLARVIATESSSSVSSISAAPISSEPNLVEATSADVGVLRRWQPLDDQRVILEALNQNWINDCVDRASVNILGVVVQRAGRRRKDRVHYR